MGLAFSRALNSSFETLFPEPWTEPRGILLGPWMGLLLWFLVMSGILGAGWWVAVKRNKV